jgi:hypothetical protein
MLKNIRNINVKFSMASMEKYFGGKELPLVQVIGSIFQRNTT